MNSSLGADAGRRPTSTIKDEKNDYHSKKEPVLQGGLVLISQLLGLRNTFNLQPYFPLIDLPQFLKVTLEHAVDVRSADGTFGVAFILPQVAFTDKSAAFRNFPAALIGIITLQEHSMSLQIIE